MSNDYDDSSLLFGMIPSNLRKPEQVARWQIAGETPTYKLLREPVSIEELNAITQGVAVWRNNDTLTYVVPIDTDDSPNDRERCLSFMIDKRSPILHIFGDTDSAIQETAEYFLNLKGVAGGNCYFGASDCSHDIFNFSAVPPRCLERILDVDFSCRVKFQELTLSAEQSVVLATRPQPMELTLAWCTFEDGGAAFVDSLEKRQSPFGSLMMETSSAFDYDNEKRLLNLNVLNHVALPYSHDELAWLSLSARVESLEYKVLPRALSEADLQSLEISAKKLTLYINCDQGGEEDETFPTELMVSFWRRVAELGHFVELKVVVVLNSDFSREPVPLPGCVLQEIIRATIANCNLKVLDLSTYDRDLDWGPQIETLFQCFKDHKALHTFRLEVNDEDDDFGPHMSHIRDLLSHKRNFTVTSSAGEIYTDGWLVDKLYSLNRFYRGSANLILEPSSERSSLVVIALLKSASQSFQRSALLLANHTDALYEFIQCAPLDELAKDHDSSSQSPSCRRGQKRRRWMRKLSPYGTYIDI